MYAYDCAAVEGLSETFRCLMGVKQRCPLSPTLFFLTAECFFQVCSGGGIASYIPGFEANRESRAASSQDPDTYTSGGNNTGSNAGGGVASYIPGTEANRESHAAHGQDPNYGMDGRTRATRAMARASTRAMARAPTRAVATRANRAMVSICPQSDMLTLVCQVAAATFVKPRLYAHIACSMICMRCCQTNNLDNITYSIRCLQCIHLTASASFVTNAYISCCEGVHRHHKL